MPIYEALLPHEPGPSCGEQGRGDSVCEDSGEHTCAARQTSAGRAEVFGIRASGGSRGAPRSEAPALRDLRAGLAVRMARAGLILIGLLVGLDAAMDTGATGEEALLLGPAPGMPEEPGRAAASPDDAALVQSWLSRFGTLGKPPGTFPPAAVSSSGNETSDHRRLQGAHSTPRFFARFCAN